MNKAKTTRNKTIYKMWMGRRTLREIAKMHRISVTRVHQIVQAQKAKSTR